MSGEALRRDDALRARMRGFRARVASAEAIVADSVGAMRTPYVAFSGGKDSLVCLDLVRRQRPEVPAIWADDELEYPETVSGVPHACEALGVRLVVVAGHARHAGWFDPWSGDPPFRAPLPQMLRIGQRMEDWSLAAGYDGCYLGLRGRDRDEIRARRINLALRGPCYRLAGDGQWRCHPLARWRLEDVWAYIAECALPYNPAYDVMARIGVPRHEQRVGPLPLSPRWVLEGGWLPLYRRLTARYGEMWSGGTLPTEPVTADRRGHRG